MPIVWTQPQAVRAFGLLCGLALVAIGCTTSTTASTVSTGTTPRITFARSTTWHAVSITAPAGARDASLTAISCRSAASCVAGGTAFTGTSEAFAMFYADGKWGSPTALTMPLGATYSQLNGLACVKTAPCVAVGTYQTQAGGTVGFVAEQSGRSWGPVTPLPLPAGDSISSLNAVTCTAPGSCVAVGSLSPPQGGDVPMVAAVVAGRWQQATEIRPPAKPTPQFSGDQLWSVACQRTGCCVAVGEYNVSADSTHLLRRPMIATESDGHWLPARGVSAPADVATIANAPGIGGLDDAGLRSVSCPQQGQCLASGSYLAAPAQGRGLAVSGVDRRWSPPQELIPAKAVVSACTIGYCLVVGSGAAPNSPGMAISYAGGRWSQVAAIHPPADASRSAPPLPGYDLEIGGVACFPGGYCIAVGSYIVHRHGQPLPMTVPMIATRS